MITPLDIQNKTFTKAMRGYKPEEVDMFLDQLTLDMEKLIKENNRLQKESGAMQEDLTNYKNSEGEVVAVLEQAKQLMDEISKSAEKRAEVIIKNAELDAAMIVREAKDNALGLKDEYLALKNKYENYRARMEKMLRDELAQLEAPSEEMFPDSDLAKLDEMFEKVEANEKTSAGDIAVSDVQELVEMDGTSEEADETVVLTSDQVAKIQEEADANATDSDKTMILHMDKGEE